MLKKILRKLINIPYSFKFRFYNRFNRFYFRLYNIKFGANLKVYNKVYLKTLGGKVIIGDNFTFSSGDSINPICRNIKGCIHVRQNASLIIGDNVGMSSPCIWVKEKIVVGNNVNIGGDCIIMDNDAHSLDYRFRNRTIVDKNGESLDSVKCLSSPIIIEDDVWVGMRTMILKGVTIGARSIIGAGSVVTKPIPPDCIAAGNPCKVIKYLNIK